jgi:hypothetical protein
MSGNLIAGQITIPVAFRLGGKHGRQQSGARLAMTFQQLDPRANDIGRVVVVASRDRVRRELLQLRR